MLTKEHFKDCILHPIGSRRYNFTSAADPGVLSNHINAWKILLNKDLTRVLRIKFLFEALLIHVVVSTGASASYIRIDVAFPSVYMLKTIYELVDDNIKEEIGKYVRNNTYLANEKDIWIMPFILGSVSD